MFTLIHGFDVLYSHLSTKFFVTKKCILILNNKYKFHKLVINCILHSSNAFHWEINSKFIFKDIGLDFNHYGNIYVYWM